MQAMSQDVEALPDWLTDWSACLSGFHGGHAAITTKGY